MSIKFTQFLRPNGTPVPVEVDMPEDVEKMAHQLIDSGYKFEIEQLTTGEVHMDCSKPGAEAPIALELCQNGPSVIDAIDRLVRLSHMKAFSKKIEVFEEDENPEEFWN